MAHSAHFTFQDAAEIVSPMVPHARDSAPWSGPSPKLFPETWGTLFADEPHLGSVGLWYDRAATKHFACRVPADVGSEIVHSGRRFDVVRLSDAAAQDHQCAA